MKTYRSLPMDWPSRLQRRWWDPTRLLRRLSENQFEWLTFPATPEATGKDVPGWREAWPRVIMQAEVVPFYLVYRTEGGFQQRTWLRKWGPVAPAIGDESVSFTAFTFGLWSDEPHRIDPVKLKLLTPDPIPLRNVSRSVILV